MKHLFVLLVFFSSFLEVDAEKHKVCFENIPIGTYAVSVTESVVNANDTDRITRSLAPISPTDIVKIREEYPPMYFSYETEQVISGRVKGTFGKVKKPQLNIFVPKTGYKDTYDMEGKQRFHLTGMEFLDGTEYVLQVTKRSGRDNLVQLYVDEPFFPEISVKAFQRIRENKNDSITDILKSYREPEIYKTIELPDLVTTTNRIKPMNYHGQMPAKGFTSKDPFLANAKTMDQVLTRLGFFITNKYGIKFPYKWCAVSYGWITRIEKVIPAIHVDNWHLDADEIEEIWNIDPQSIQQIEYFPEEQSTETKFTLHSTQAGALCIFTCGVSRKPLSTVVVKQIGYQPEHIFDDAEKHGATIMWNPSLRVESEGKTEFEFEGVAERKYSVVLEGVSDSGEPVRKEVVL